MDPKTMMQVPPQVREMAEKTVEQAEKAFQAFLQAAGNTSEMVPGVGGDLTKKVISLTEDNIKAAFDHAKALIHANDMTEIMRLQTEFIQKQFAAAGEQMKQLSGSASDAAGKVVPLR